MTRALRLPNPSLSLPEKIFTNEVVASAVPSIRPTERMLTPRTVTRNGGNRPWIIADDMAHTQADESERGDIARQFRRRTLSAGQGSCLIRGAAETGFDLRSRSYPGQLRKVLAGRGHPGDAARQLPDNPGCVPISADPKRIRAFELKEISELVEAACDIGIQDRYDPALPMLCVPRSKRLSGFLRIDPDQYKFPGPVDADQERPAPFRSLSPVAWRSRDGARIRSACNDQRADRI